MPGQSRAIESATLTLRTRALGTGTHTLTAQLLGVGVRVEHQTLYGSAIVTAVRR